jgi:hypothetical protein
VLAVLLGLQEGLLELVGICRFVLVVVKGIRVQTSSRTVRVGESNSQGNSLGLALADISGSVPHPAAVRADVGGQGDLGDNCAQTCVSKATRVRRNVWGSNIL